MTRTYPRLRCMALCLWIAVLAYFSLVPEGATSAAGIKLWDKFSHFGAYAVLAMLAMLLVQTRPGCWPPSFRLLMVVWLFCFTYGLLLECLQGAMTFGRQYQNRDLLANGLGALAGCVFFCRRPKRWSDLWTRHKN